jgi:hypothetical protein
MQDKIDLITGKSFMLDRLLYKCEFAKKVSQNLMIKTNRKTIVLEPKEIEIFFNVIEFVGPANNSANIEKMPISNVVNVEIRKANELASDMTSKLKAMFDVLAEEPTPSAFKKADAMVKASNAIVNVQMANYKYLLLKDR